jgi:hypothetical protein
MKYRIQVKDPRKVLMGGRPNTSRAQQPKTPHQIAFDLREQARSLCPRAIEVIRECLHSDDERVRLLAAQLAFDRGFGKAPVTADVNLNHNFCEVPQVLSEEEWLKQVQEMRARQERLARADPSPHAASTAHWPVIDLVEEPPEDKTNLS